MPRYSIARISLPMELSTLRKDLNLDVSAVAMGNKPIPKQNQLVVKCLARSVFELSELPRDAGILLCRDEWPGIGYHSRRNQPLVQVIAFRNFIFGNELNCTTRFTYVALRYC